MNLTPISINEDNLAVITIMSQSLEITQDEAVSLLTDLGIIAFCDNEDGAEKFGTAMLEKFGQKKLDLLNMNLSAYFNM